jgi:ubiquitin-activating enzyme E1
MDLISGLPNMRARNYSIQGVDHLKAKLIARLIIPAIANATAAATGLVCLELYKTLARNPNLSAYRNTFANLAVPLFSMAEPVPPKTVCHGNASWTIWDRWIIEGDVTLREVWIGLSAKGLTAYSISCSRSLLYNNTFPRHQERLERKVAELAHEVAKVEVPSYRRYLDVVAGCEDEEGNDVDMPLISIYFR